MLASFSAWREGEGVVSLEHMTERGDPKKKLSSDQSGFSKLTFEKKERREDSNFER
jgi:hypothetical protein